MQTPVTAAFDAVLTIPTVTIEEGLALDSATALGEGAERRG